MLAALDKARTWLLLRIQRPRGGIDQATKGAGTGYQLAVANRYRMADGNAAWRWSEACLSRSNLVAKSRL